MRRLTLLVFALILPAISGTSHSADLTFNTQDFAPFSYQVNGVVAGPATEIISKVCARINANCTFALLPWKRAQQEVKLGKANGMFVIGWNKGRAEWVHFSPPIMKTEYGFFVHQSNGLTYKDLKDIEGKTVSVYGPSNTSKSLRALQAKMKSMSLKPIKVDMRPDDEAGFKKLALRRVDAVFSNRDVGFALAAKLGVKEKVRYAGKTKELNYYIGFAAARNDSKLLSAFNSAFEELDNAGAIRKVLEKYGMLSADPQLIPANFNER
jgi:polar amino acid transport system substrate-binding protein